MRRPSRTAAKALFMAAGLVLACASSAGAAEHRFGLGELYWRSLGDLGGSGLKSDGIAPYLTYQYVPAGIFKLEVDLEYYRQGFGGADASAYSPVVFAIAELGFYAGVGVGVTVSNAFSGNVSDPFYAGRVGWDFQLIPRLHFDVNANYRAQSFKALKGYNQDSLTFGAAARVAF
jgi:hypothetical protein